MHFHVLIGTVICFGLIRTACRGCIAAAIINCSCHRFLLVFTTVAAPFLLI